MEELDNEYNEEKCLRIFENLESKGQFTLTRRGRKLGIRHSYDLSVKSSQRVVVNPPDGVGAYQMPSYQEILKEVVLVGRESRMIVPPCFDLVLDTAVHRGKLIP